MARVKAQLNSVPLILILVLTFKSGTSGVDSFGCNGKTSCQTIPSNCKDDHCSVGVTVVKTKDDEYTFNAQGPGSSDSYVAVGISNDDSMGGDAVVACTSSGVALYVNPLKHRPSEANNWKTGSPSSKSSAVTNGKLTCSFTLPEVIEASNTPTLKVGDSYILVASGPTSSGRPQHHTYYRSGKLNLKNSGSGKPNLGTTTLPTVVLLGVLLLLVL